MERWLYNPITKVLSQDGDGKQYADAYKFAMVEELETGHSFVMAGTLEDGTPVRAELSIADYFEGKNFIVKG